MEDIDLTDEQINLINETDALGEQIKGHIEKLREADADPRWLDIATTNMQQGGMALYRAICKPEEFF
jgi:hypothetical protein